MKIEAGRFYRTRAGQKVGPMARANATEHRCGYGVSLYTHYVETGRVRSDGSDDPHDLVAEWTDTPDLTSITTPYGLLDEATQDALKSHGGPYEIWCRLDEWAERDDPDWLPAFVYRVKPQPPKPREVTGVWNAGRSCFEIHVTNVNYPHLTAIKFTGVLPD